MFVGSQARGHGGQQNTEPPTRGSRSGKNTRWVTAENCCRVFDAELIDLSFFAPFCRSNPGF